MTMILSTLVQAAAEIESGQIFEAKALLAQIQSGAANRASPEERLSQIFVRALQARASGDLSGAGNLYDVGEAYTEHDMLLAFQTLVEATPLVRFGYNYANRTLFQALKNEPYIHLVDIGIGMGTQWLDFFEHLSSSDHDIHHIRLTGLDLPFSEADPLRRLNQVGLMLQTKAAALELPFTFQPIPAKVESFDFASLALSDQETLAINATLALHHTPAADAVTKPEQSRDAILNRIQQLHPRLMTLIEPDTEHNALPLLNRLPEAFYHYLTVFEAIDALLPDSSRAKSILENAFFGREIVNVISAEGQARVERHERRDAWRKRLSGLGFRLLPATTSAIRQGQQGLHLKSPFSLHLNAGMVSLNFLGRSIVAASAWTV